MSDDRWLSRLPRFRSHRVWLSLTCAAGLAVGAVGTAVVTALAGALDPGITSAQAGLPSSPAFGALLGLCVFLPATAIWGLLIIEKPRAARWGAAGYAVLMVYLYSVRLRDSLTWFTALLAAVAVLSVWLLPPWLVFRRPGRRGPAGRPQRGRASGRGRGRAARRR